MVEYAYTVTYDPDGANIDITNDVEVLEVTETGTGEVNTADIRFNANFGKTLVSAPIFTQFDRILVTITDSNSNTLRRVYEVDNVVPLLSAQSGITSRIECLGLESHLNNVTFTRVGQFQFSSMFTAVRDILNDYNEIRVTAGATQPEVIDHTATTAGGGGNDLAQFNANTYPFTREEFCYKGIEFIVNAAGAAVANNGAGDFFEFNFPNNPANNNQIQFRGFSSGSTGTVSITNSVAVNPGESEGGIEAFTGSLIKAWGSEDGSLPPDLTNFLGDQEAFLLIPDFDSSITYPQDAFVQFEGDVYQSDINNNNNTPPTDWTIQTFADFHGSADYSIWTINKSAHIQNGGSNPLPSKHGAVTGFNQSGMWDGNLHIADEARFQTDVIERIRQTGDIDVNYMYNQNSAGSYRGMRFLVDSNIGALGFPFTQNGGEDRFGNAYSDKIVRRNNFAFTGADEFRNWDVVAPLNDTGGIRAPIAGDVVSVTDEGKVYRFNGAIWVDDSTSARQNHCFHIYNTIGNVKGAIDVDDGGGGSFADDSAVQITWRYTPFVNVGASILTSEDFYKQGAWFCFRLPYPFSTHNAVPTLGELYGNNATKKEPVTIDSENMHLTHSGFAGFNNAEAEDKGPLNSIRFWIKHNWFINMSISGDKQVFAGDFKYRCLCYDTSRNVVAQDFVVAHNNNYEQVTLDLEGFKPYRARTPKSLGNIQSTLIPQGIEVLNRFEWKNFAMCVIQWQEPYDDLGRYSPEGTRVVTQALAQFGIEFALGGGLLNHAQVNLEIDGFHFGKTLLSVTAPVTSGRVKEPPAMELPFISNKFQLDQVVNSQLEIEQFQHQQFDVTTEGRLDINFGENFFYEDDFIVNRADRNESTPGANDGDANTIALVAKKITHRIDKPATGPGGFLTTFMGIKRFVS